MLVEVAHTEAPNGKADFAMEHASVSNIGYKKLSDSCTAAEYADGKGEDDMEDILEEEWDLFKENVKAAVEKDPELPKGFESLHKVFAELNW